MNTRTSSFKESKSPNKASRSCGGGALPSLAMRCNRPASRELSCCTAFSRASNVSFICVTAASWPSLDAPSARGAKSTICSSAPRALSNCGRSNASRGFTAGSLATGVGDRAAGEWLRAAARRCAPSYASLERDGLRPGMSPRLSRLFRTLRASRCNARIRSSCCCFSCSHCRCFSAMTPSMNFISSFFCTMLCSRVSISRITASISCRSWSFIIDLPNGEYADNGEDSASGRSSRCSWIMKLHTS
mmetsp:Transcript_126423/g.223993  ORF Transcript_126423/g.223993 Transcript_126423/m.223993 type:complete len:246 (-) Transcript_126423:126-863(-)